MLVQATNTWAFASIGVQPMSLGVIIGLVVLVALLACSALMSGSESAYFSLSPTCIHNLQNSKNRSDIKVLRNLNNSERLLATILICNNLVNVGIVIVSNFITHSLFNFTQAPVVGFLFEVVVITFLLLLFGEIMPKIFATHRSLPFARMMAGTLHLLIIINKPLTSLLVKSVGRFGKHQQVRNNISMDQLSDAIEITNEQDIGPEKRILKGIATFGNLMVSEIMKPRVDVVAVDQEAPFSEVVKTAMESGYSRIPVFAESFDSIKGILFIKDLIQFIGRGDDFKWQALVRNAYFVPESKKINDLLTEFQTKKIHLAIVVDEYGGNNGIITLEDILEEIVGEISDESDEDEQLYTRINDHTFLFEAKIQINDFCKVVNCDDKIFDDVRGEAETLAGLTLEITGQMPEKGHKINCKQFQFIIESVDNKRIKKIKVMITPLANDKKK